MTKYEQIMNDIKSKIASHQYKENQVIPSEHQMCEEYGVSRITVRKAIDCLVNEGMLYRISRKGCFVRETADQKLSHIYSFTEAILNQGRTPSRKQLSLTKEPAGDQYAKLFSIDKKEVVYILKCLYFADGTPYCVNSSVLPENRFPKLEFFDFNSRSLYDVLKSFYDLNMSRATQNISAVRGNEEVCDFLHIDSAQPLLRINATSFCLDGGKEHAFERYEADILTDILDYYVEKYD